MLRSRDAPCYGARSNTFIASPAFIPSPQLTSHRRPPVATTTTIIIIIKYQKDHTGGVTTVQGPQGIYFSQAKQITCALPRP